MHGHCALTILIHCLIAFLIDTRIPSKCNLTPETCKTIAIGSNLWRSKVNIRYVQLKNVHIMFYSQTPEVATVASGSNFADWRCPIGWRVSG
jgi:hypothetical protein